MNSYKGVSHESFDESEESAQLDEEEKKVPTFSSSSACTESLENVPGGPEDQVQESAIKSELLNEQKQLVKKLTKHYVRQVTLGGLIFQENEHFFALNQLQIRKGKELDRKLQVIRYAQGLKPVEKN